MANYRVRRLYFHYVCLLQRTCRSSRSALADVLYSIRRCVCRSTGRLRDPARTDVSSCLSSDHNMAHRHWTGRQTEVEWGWGRGWEEERERQIITVCKCHPWARPPLGQPLRMLQLVLPSHSSTSGSACDSWVVLHAGNHWAGKHPSSKVPLAHAPKPSCDDWTACKCPVCVRHAVSKGLVQDMQHKTTLIWLMGRWQHTSHSHS